MNRKFLTLSFVTILAAWISTANAGPGHSVATQCFLWANKPTSAIGSPYNPNPTYSFSANGNSAADISVTRIGVGLYNVTCKGVGGAKWAAVGGHVQVTAYGPTDAYCKVQSWTSVPADFTAKVNCYSSAGVAIDSMFNLSFVW